MGACVAAAWLNGDAWLSAASRSRVASWLRVVSWLRACVRLHAGAALRMALCLAVATCLLNCAHCVVARLRVATLLCAVGRLGAVAWPCAAAWLSWSVRRRRLAECRDSRLRA